MKTPTVEMLKKGYIREFREAFEPGKLLGSPEIRKIRKKKIKAREAIRLILNAGGIPVLAHPMKVSGLKTSETMGTEEYMEEKFKNIPEECDIIISHDPPYDISFADTILQKPRWSNEGLEHVGNPPLAKRLSEIKYKLLVCGHIHSGDHDLFEFNGGQIVNVSIKDENYKVNYEPFYIEI